MLPEETPPLRAVALIRMSTARQENSPERQREGFARYCARWDLVPVDEYEDLATSLCQKFPRHPGRYRLAEGVRSGVGT